MRATAVRDALRERNVRLLVGSGAVDALGNGMANSSFDWFGSVALNPIGFVLVGPLANHLGVAKTLYLAAAANALVTLTVASTPAIRNLRAEPAAVAATA